MGKSFEVQGPQQLPVWTVERVDCFDIFLLAERCSIHCHIDHLKSNHCLDLGHMQSRLEQPRSHRMPQVRSRASGSPTFRTERRWVL
jgi:hypothetical protein